MRIVFLRHGVASEDGWLSPEGSDQARRMGERLAGWQWAGPAQIFSSRSDRTTTCAEIIGHLLGATYVTHDLTEAWSSGCAPVGHIALKKEVGESCQLAVIITHRPEVVGAFEYFTNSERYRLIGEGPRIIDPMQGYLVDLEEKTIQFIAHDEQ